MSRLNDSINKDINKLNINDDDVFLFTSIIESGAFYMSEIKEDVNGDYLEKVVEIYIDDKSSLNRDMTWMELKENKVFIVTELKKGGFNSENTYYNPKVYDDCDFIQDCLDEAIKNTSINEIIKQVGADETIDLALDYKNNN